MSQQNAEAYYEHSKSYFDTAGAQKQGYFDSKRSFAYFCQERIKKQALAAVGADEPGAILDACCGRGDFLARIAARYPGSKLRGIDFSEGMIRVAQSSWKELSPDVFQQANLLQLPFPDQSFDVTFCLGTFHILQRKDFPLCISELTRVTRRSVILDFRNERSLFWSLYQYLFQFGSPGFECNGTTIDELRSLVRKHDFSIQHVAPIFQFQIVSPVILTRFVRNP